VTRHKSINTNKITPLKPGLKKWQIGTFDLETRPVNGEDSLLAPFCMGATYYNSDTVLWDTVLSMLQYMLSRGSNVRWYAHNGAGFDFKYILTDTDCIKWLALMEWECHIIGGKAPKGLIFKRGEEKISFCDSAKLMPDSLSRLSKSFDTVTPKGFINFANGEIFEPENPEHIEYLKADVISLYEIITAYRATINKSFRQEPRFTASSTAFACFRTILNKTIWRHPAKVNEWIHGIDSEGVSIPKTGCYYGGRTETFFQGVSEQITYIDVNSLYAHIMYEYGGIHRPYYTRNYEPGVPGFYRVNARARAGKFGFLPYRLDNGGLAHPIGNFETCCSNLEINLAREQGWQVDIIDGWAFEEWDKDLFKPFIEKCKLLRQQDYSGALGITAKFLQNNLYGFFGMKPHRPETIFSASMPEEEGFEPCVDTETGRLMYHIWERQTKQDTINCIPAFAAWITAAARIFLTRAMIAEEQAGNTVLYCDTDSIFLTGNPVSNMSDGVYGSFKVEHVWDELMTISPKMYAGKRLDVDRVVRDFRAKGIPKNLLSLDLYQDAAVGVPTVIQYPQLFSLIRSAKNGKLGTSAVRSSATVNSISNRVPSLSGYTSPIVLNQTF
jgi:hypothetical protein